MTTGQDRLSAQPMTVDQLTLAALSELADQLCRGNSAETERVGRGYTIGWRSTVGPEPRWWQVSARAHRAGWLAALRCAADQIRLIRDADPAIVPVRGSR